MHRNSKSNFRTNNAITFNVIANKIIKEHTIIDDTKFSKKVNNKVYYKTPEKKYKNDDISSMISFVSLLSTSIIKILYFFSNALL